MDFEQTFASWLTSSLEEELPGSVKAFSFNLYEPALVDGVKFGIELIGAGEFNKDDPDWACDEVWEPETRGINIQVAYSGDQWEQCLQNLKALLIRTLDSDSPAVRKLKSSQGIAIGFVDGDLEIVWKP